MPMSLRGHLEVLLSVPTDNPSLIPLVTFPEAFKGIIYSDLNYSVILQWVAIMHPEPVLSWTFNGKPCGTGEKLFIRRLSPNQLGTYLCIAKNTDKELVSEPVTVSLSRKCPGISSHMGLRLASSLHSTPDVYGQNVAPCFLLHRRLWLTSLFSHVFLHECLHVYLCTYEGQRLSGLPSWLPTLFPEAEFLS